MQKNYLAIDIGASSGRTVIWNGTSTACLPM